MNPVSLALLVAILSTPPGPLPQRGKDLNEIGLKAVARGDYAAGVAAMSESLKIWQALGHNFQPHAVIESLNLGDALCAEGKWDEGSKLFDQALDLSRHALGANHLLTVTSRNRIANVFLLQGQLERAEPIYIEALAIERQLYPHDIQTAHTLAGLGALHSREAKPDVALAEAEESLEITLREAGENSTEAGMAYANVAQLHNLAGRLDRALPLWRKARAIFERNLGPAHPRVASVMSQEGLALLQENKVALAEPEIAGAVDLLTKAHATNVELAVAQHNLGLLRMKQKKYSAADQLFSQALALEEQYSVEPGPEMASTLEQLSNCREKEHRLDDAARFKSRANSILSYR